MTTDNFSIDTSDMQKCARDLAEAGAMLDEVVPVAVRAGGRVVEISARSLSSWSSRIPASIQVNSMGDTVLIRAGGATAPHAAVYEHGGRPGAFVHPTFGHQPWVPQQARPFLSPSMILGEETTERVGAEQTDRVLRSRGL